MTPRTTRRIRVATAVPLALVAAAWTSNLSGTTVAGAPAPAPPTARKVPSLPDGTTVPPRAIDSPASLSDPTTVLEAGDQRFAQVAVRPDAGDLPSGALAAYQRAETIINAADPACGLQWQLVAAIGRVESDHGRFGGSTVGPSGRVSPAIVGLALNGRNGTALIRDTDAGQYDGDVTFDRAVGPMQFIPSTWAVVGVDADNDGVRDPQDIDDAALATAVYLCSGQEDLATASGRRPAVYRYNHSNSYVELVLGIMDSYLQGSFDTTTGPLISAGYVGPLAGGAYPTSNTGDAAVKPAEVLAEDLPPGVVAWGPDPAADPVDEPSDALPDGDAIESAVPVIVPPVEIGGDDSVVLPGDEPVEAGTEDPGAPADPADPADEGDEDGDEPLPGDEPVPGDETTPGDGTDPTDPADPADDTETPVPSDEPPTDETTPEEGPDPDEVGPEPGSMTPEEAAEYCADEGLENDPADDADQYDLCVAESSGRGVPTAPPGPQDLPLRHEATTGRD